MSVPAAKSDEEAWLSRLARPHENIGFYGTFSFEVASELAQLVDGYRPLRPPRP